MSEQSYAYAPYAQVPGAVGYQNPAPQYAQQQYAPQQYAPQQPAQPQYLQQRVAVAEGLGAQAKAPAVSVPGTGLTSWFNVTQPAYLKGLLLGAGVALVVTNPTVQKALIGGAVRVWAAVQGGVEEIKEQIEDVKAELSREG